MTRTCRRCGHTYDFHQHLHDRDYCGVLGCDCLSYKRRWWWSR